MLAAVSLEIDAGNRHNKRQECKRIMDMPRLLLLRHAKAERSLAGQRDRDRPLADRGRRDAPVIGSYLADHDLAPDAAVVSPSARTRETWQLIAKCLDPAPDAEFEDRLYDASPDDILEAIKDSGLKANTLLVVGHNPGLHELANGLIGSGDRIARARLHEALPTSGLVVIDFKGKAWMQLQPHSGRLERFVTPRFLAGDSE